MGVENGNNNEQVVTHETNDEGLDEITINSELLNKKIDEAFGKQNDFVRNNSDLVIAQQIESINIMIAEKAGELGIDTFWGFDENKESDIFKIIVDTLNDDIENELSKTDGKRSDVLDLLRKEDLLNSASVKSVKKELMADLNQNNTEIASVDNTEGEGFVSIVRNNILNHIPNNPISQYASGVVSSVEKNKAGL